MKNNKDYLFGLIFTIILFLILDQFASDVSILMRVLIVFILLLIGRFVFTQLFIERKDSE